MSVVVRDLCKRYGPRTAVDHVSFSIQPGEIVGLIGPNGSGKSTILRILATCVVPTSGTALLAGYDCLREPLRAKGTMGYLPEALPDPGDVRVIEYLSHRACLKQVPSRVRGREVDRCLAACDLRAVRQRFVSRLSQGFRRRVALADALLGAPAVLLLDEPTIGLDPLQVRAVRALLHNEARRAAILFSTHLLAEAEAVSTRAVVLLHGRLRGDFRLDDVAGDNFEIGLSSPVDECLEVVRAVPGVARVETVESRRDRCTLRVAPASGSVELNACRHTRGTRERVVAACVANGLGVESLRAAGQTLEERFLRLAVGVNGEAA